MKLRRLASRVRGLKERTCCTFGSQHPPGWSSDAWPVAYAAWKREHVVQSALNTHQDEAQTRGQSRTRPERGNTLYIRLSTPTRMKLWCLASRVRGLKERTHCTSGSQHPPGWSSGRLASRVRGLKERTRCTSGSQHPPGWSSGRLASRVRGLKEGTRYTSGSRQTFFLLEGQCHEIFGFSWFQWIIFFRALTIFSNIRGQFKGGPPVWKTSVVNGNCWVACRYTYR
jgi:hypothetical protein